MAWALSDAEVEFEEKDGSFWHLKYPLADGSGYVQLDTTRPETMLGDTAGLHLQKIAALLQVLDYLFAGLHHAEPLVLSAGH